VPLIHSKVTFGYAIESSSGIRFAYLTDTLGLPPRTETFLTDWHPHGLALDCSFAPQSEPKNHNDWTTALAVIDKVNAETNRLLAMPATQARLADLAIEPMGGSAADFNKLIADELRRWGEVVRKSGASPD
jgi:phosphoribosyl 1,2-cyclic phosphodiesterase